MYICMYVQKEGGKYGLLLNLNKCELIRIARNNDLNETDKVTFINNEKVKEVTSAKYLGCWLNDKGDPAREVKQRITICMTILKRLDIYWLHANPSAKHKLLVYDAIIRSKLLYGLESTAMNSTVKHSLDIFQLKGLRKILNIKTTFVDRTQDSERVYTQMQDEIHRKTTVGKREKLIKPYSKIYEEQKSKLLNKIINAPPDTPIRHCTFRPNSIEPIQIKDKGNVKRRSGKPRVKWVETGMERLWSLIGNSTRPDLKYSIMNLQNPEHVAAIERAARMNIYQDSPSYIIRE